MKGNYVQGKVLTRAVLRPVATGRRTPAWLSFPSLPSRTIRKIQGATSSVKELTQRRQDAMSAKQKFLATSRLCVFALKISPPNMPPRRACSSPSGWERMPKAGEGFSFFGFGSTNMPRRRRWGRTPCQNHFALDVWGERARHGRSFQRPRWKHWAGGSGFDEGVEPDSRGGCAPHSGRILFGTVDLAFEFFVARSTRRRRSP